MEDARAAVAGAEYFGGVERQARPVDGRRDKSLRER